MRWPPTLYLQRPQEGESMKEVSKAEEGERDRAVIRLTRTASDSDCIGIRVRSTEYVGRFVGPLVEMGGGGRRAAALVGGGGCAYGGAWTSTEYGAQGAITQWFSLPFT